MCYLVIPGLKKYDPLDICRIAEMMCSVASSFYTPLGTCRQCIHNKANMTT